MSDRISTGVDCDKVHYSSVVIYIGDKKYPTIEAETLLEAIKQFDHWRTFHHIGSEVKE